MQLDKNMLARLSALDDDALWQTIRAIAASGGASLPTQMPTDKDMQTIRKAMSNATDKDIDIAKDLLEKYKNSR